MYIVQVMIWDDHQGRCIGELNFRTQVSPHSLLVSTCMHQEGIALLASFTVRMSISGEMPSTLLHMCR